MNCANPNKPGTSTQRKFIGAISGILVTLLACAAVAAEVQELKIPKGAGGIGFLPLLVMEQQKLIEKHAGLLGNKSLKVTYANLGGPAVVNDALLSGAAHMAPAGPPAFLFLWDRTRDNAQITGIAAMSSLPMYLNTTNPNIKALRDIGEKDRMAVTVIKVSIPSIIMQMAARKESRRVGNLLPTRTMLDLAKRPEMDTWATSCLPYRL